MRKAAGGWLARATNYYRRRSIQFMISLSFSIAAMAGMLFLGCGSPLPPRRWSARKTSV